MELSILLLLALFTGLLLLLARSYPKAQGHLPPGPSPLPFLGNLLQMDRGGLLKSFLKVHGSIGAGGSGWKTLRAFSLPPPRNFGREKKRQRHTRQTDQAQKKFYREKLGALLDPTFFFHAITANIICSMVFGERFAYKDPQFLRLLDTFYQTFALVSSFSSQLYCIAHRLLKHFPGPHRQVYKNLQKVNTFISCSVAKHRETLDPSTPRDFIDTYLLRMDKEKSNPNTEFHQRNLILTALSLFFGGTETTSTTLRYGFLLMLKYPHIAEKVRKEIEQVIGSHRPPALDDRAKMPYTDAVIHEIQRFGDFLPIGVPHMVTKDTYFRGYIIPKGAQQDVTIRSIHTSTHVEEPERQRIPHGMCTCHVPTLVISPSSVPTGKRICLGEGIARAELFLFFTTILQNFSVASPVAPKDVSLMPLESGFGKMPPMYQICFL
uniref:Cytochrome P450 family 2 subfamily B member 6 n=1 Tax=Loxodonta africana TaxID=9785 RepID=G3TZM7_LOXAF